MREITNGVPARSVQPRWQRSLKGIRRHWQLYFVIFLPIVYVVVFKYIPLWGSQIAFKDYKLSLGISGSPWAEPIFKHFIKFFGANQFERLMVNTITLSLYNIGVKMIPPIILAISLNYVVNRRFGKTVQMVTYMPYFISTVLVVGIVTQMLSLSGPVNNVIKSMGGMPIHFLSKPEWFKTIYVFSGVWQNTGYDAVIYIAALAAIPPEQHEAAIVDGATIWQRIWHVDLPALIPTAMILLILNCGKVLTVGHEKVLLLQNMQNLRSSDIISTYVYRIGLAEGMQYSYSTAIGLFQSVVSLLLLVTVNTISRWISESSLW